MLILFVEFSMNISFAAHLVPLPQAEDNEPSLLINSNKMSLPNNGFLSNIIWSQPIPNLLFAIFFATILFNSIPSRQSMITKSFPIPCIFVKFTIPAIYFILSSKLS